MAELFAADPELMAPLDAPAGVPNYSLVLLDEVGGGWHVVAVIRRSVSPDFFLRSISVPWPFVAARLRPSTRQSEVVLPPEKMSPAKTTPAQKLVVNWPWEQRDDATEQLRFYVRCGGPLLFWPKRRLRVRLGLKQQSIGRRHVVRLVSEPVNWRAHHAAQFVAPPNSLRA